MTISDLEHFKKVLIEREHNLLEWLEMPDPATAQDIAKAESLLGEISKALKRTEDKSYGSCDVCKGEIELYRLEIQPVTEVCLSCISNQERAELEEELFLASKIHRALLPQTVEKINGFEIAVRSIASRIVCGDYYDFLPAVNSGMVRVIVADTMGKGLPAGLLMSNVQGALRVLAEDINSPKELISKLNRWLCRNVPVTKFISLICLGLETNGNRHFVYTNAGHCPAILVRQNGEVEMLNPTGGVIGVHLGFEYEEKGLSISPGDLLLLYTDGIIEARRADGEMFGEQRLIDYIRSRENSDLNELVDGLINEVKAFSARSEFEDDLTILSLRRTSI
jgi:sigma-B regulation protein RsbU (phosphoserine phosphatase)